MSTPISSKSLTQDLSSGHCALIVIDMQNDFCAPGGYIDTVMKKDVSGAEAILPALTQLIDAARANNVPVVWVGSDYSPGRIPASMQRKLTQRGITAICCEPGTWGADWFGVQPQPHEPIIIKHSYSGFSGTKLQALLSEHQINTLVFAGVQTQVCVESTVREAHSLGYTAVVVKDAVGSHSPNLHEASLLNVQFLFGELSNVDETTKAWQTQPVN